MSPEDQRAYDSLELRIQTILPEQYQDCYDEVEPVSMGSAGLKYGKDGKVAWQDIWKHFCDLAMAGGPPHKGKLLLPATPLEIQADPDRYTQVVEEICRGIKLVTFLESAPAEAPGWIRVECTTEGAAGWLARAIVMENVSARCEGTGLYVPAGPNYRIEKEVKNVITSMAKTCHYWMDHMWAAQQRIIGDLFQTIAKESPLIQPTTEADDALRTHLTNRLRDELGMEVAETQTPGWLNLPCPTIKSAIWLMRALVVANVMSRREETHLCLPLNPTTDPQGDHVLQALKKTLAFASAQGVM